MSKIVNLLIERIDPHTLDSSSVLDYLSKYQWLGDLYQKKKKLAHTPRQRVLTAYWLREQVISIEELYNSELCHVEVEEVINCFAN